MSVPQAAAHRLALLSAVPAGELLVHEVYRSLQGESTFAGLPCVFVRTTTCSLRCKWCDTPHAFTQGTRIARAALLAQVVAFDCPLVEITGGEPLEQAAEVLPLMAALCDAGKTVLIETAGAHDIAGIDPRVRVILDVKCPDSGESARNRWENLSLLKPTDEVKFVIASRADWEFADETIRAHRLAERVAVLVSAAFGHVELKELAEWVLASGLNVRMQLQMHKFVWHPQARGV